MVWILTGIYMYFGYKIAYNLHGSYYTEMRYMYMYMYMYMHGAYPGVGTCQNTSLWYM